MFFASKLLPMLVLPAGLSAFLVLAGLILLRRRPRAAAGVLVLALLLILGFGNRYVSLELMRSLEARVPPLPPTVHAEAIVVLGSGEEPAWPPRNVPRLDQGVNRLVYAAELYKSGRAPLLILSSGRSPLLGRPDDPSAADIMANFMRAMGIAPAALVEEGASRNTDENAADVAQILAARQLHRVLLVTSAYHMPRALMLFRHHGIDAIAAPTDYEVTDRELQALHSRWEDVMLALVPSADNLHLSTLALREYLGIFFYRIKER